jgi:thioredoxin-dependent peroxiredoxin
VAYFAASVDDAETNKKFAESLGLDYPILSDPGKKTAEAYGVLKSGHAARNTFYIGKDGRILYVDRAVNASLAGDDVVKKLAELKIPRREGAGK